MPHVAAPFRITALAIASALLVPTISAGQSLLGSATVASSSASATGEPASISAVEELFASRGRSGALLAMMVSPEDAVGTVPSSPLEHRWERMFDDPGVLGTAVFRSAPIRPPSLPGVWRLRLSGAGQSSNDLVVITTVPLAHKAEGYLNGYYIGRYPTEGTGRTDEYAPPANFIEVTRANQDLHVSEHFQIRDFLTKDQFDVWPKYLALDLQLVDKLELVLQELNEMGIRADRLQVMSGFRTPQYNGPGGDGRALLSRHMYGDAADVWVDSDSDGYMDDLNGDGIENFEDTYVLLRAVDRVEREHPELVGGAGQYASNSYHGPFVHIDARGSHARW